MAFKMKSPTLLKMTSALKNVQYFGTNTSHEEIKKVNDHNKDVDYKTGKHKTPNKMKSPMKDQRGTHVKEDKKQHAKADHTWESHGAPTKMKSPMKNTQYFGQNTSHEESRRVTKHNKAHKDGLPADHKKKANK